MIERIKRLRRGTKRSRNTLLRIPPNFKPRRYELARNWRLSRVPLPFSRLPLCLLERPRALVKMDSVPIRFHKQVTVHDSIRLFALRYNFRLTVFLSRFERKPEIRYAHVRPKARRPLAMREASTSTLASLPLHVPLDSTGTSGAVASEQHAMTSARYRANIHVQHTFSHDPGGGSRVGLLERISFKPPAVVHSRPMVISRSRILVLASLRQPPRPNQPNRPNRSINGRATTVLPDTTNARLMKPSGAATPAPQQLSPAARFLREVRTFSVLRQRPAVRKILHETMPPPPISIPSIYRPTNIELVSRHVSARSSSAPAIDSLERTLVANQGGHTEVRSRLETVEKEINEKIHQQVERSVREQVERTVRTDTVLVQRLAREIQSDLYRGIVVERERLGLR